MSDRADSRVSSIEVRSYALAAVDALPPTFPLATFVAANPRHGMEHLPFEAAAILAARQTGARSYLAEAEYEALFEAGRISAEDLVRAGERRARMRQPRPSGPGAVVRTMAERHDEMRGVGLADAIDAELARWCAQYLDRGQAPWPMPYRERGLYRAWRALAPRDPGLRRLAGRAGARRVASMPDDAAETLALLVGELGIAPMHCTEYFRASLRRLAGFGAAISRAHGGDGVVDVLALRLALEVLALDGFRSDVVEPTTDASLIASVERAARWQEALELGYRDRVLRMLAAAPSVPAEGRVGGPARAQVVFCIDVRSEGIRRHLEAVGPYETLGFAGFFGVPLRVGLLDREPAASCPVIVEPHATVLERVDARPEVVVEHRDRVDALGAAWEARQEAKVEPIAPFAFAEAAGWVLGPLAALATFAPRTADRLRAFARARSVPAVPTVMSVDRDHHDQDGVTTGLSLDEQVSFAHAALTTMGLRTGFAPLVVLCGHRSATTNNPFAAALDCGACAGKAGGPNARILAEIVNRADVRAELARAGIEIPPETWFVPAEHDTTTDTVRILERERVPAHRHDDLEQLDADLRRALTSLARERAQLLPGCGDDADQVRRRGADWAEAVPEWGLVRNAAVIVGPRTLTAGRDLERRIFLHSYDPDADDDGVVLQTILTGPLVVGHWISSQYYFSTVDPRSYGAGTKALHNVTGGLGVFEGPGGDLRVGLPLESVMLAGERVHEPLRLLAVVQAPRARLDALIARNAAVAQLLDNGWLRLVAGSGGADGWAERLRDGSWEPCVPPPAEVSTPRDVAGARPPAPVASRRDTMDDETGSAMEVH